MRREKGVCIRCTALLQGTKREGKRKGGKERGREGGREGGGRREAEREVSVPSERRGFLQQQSTQSR